jgi:hypothetical protein
MIIASIVLYVLIVCAIGWFLFCLIYAILRWLGIKR